MSVTRSKNLLKSSDITEEQQSAIDRLYEHDATLLVAPKGLGKTAVAQFALQELLADGVITRALVFAPPKVVALSWANEHTKWEPLGPVEVLVGTPAQREKKLISGAAICVCSYELIPWLVAQPGFQSFDAVVFDEITRMKTVGGTSYKALRHKLKQFKWRCGLSATPVAEAGDHIYGQALLLDGGKALGTSIERFRGRYMMSDFMGFKWEWVPGAQAQIASALSGLVYMAESEEYESELPPLEEHVVDIDIGPLALAAYEELAQTMVLEIEGTDGVEAPNAAVLAGKLQQVASGFIYGEDGTANILHSRKIKKMEGLVADLAQPVVIVYQYRQELEALRTMFAIKGYFVKVLAEDPAGAVAAWNAEDCDVLLVHPRSAGHGLNLQDGGCVMVQMGPIWSADQSDQIIGRIWRRGQKNTVRRYTLCSTSTIDEAILDRLDEKQENESVLMEHLRQVTQKRTTPSDGG